MEDSSEMGISLYGVVGFAWGVSKGSGHVTLLFCFILFLVYVW